MQYVRLVTRLSTLARNHGLDVLVVLLAIASAVEVAFKVDPVREPRTTAWFVVPTAALIVLPLLGRRRWPFAAPAAVWLLAAAVAVGDGRRVGFSTGCAVAGWVASFLLGQLSDAVQARLGLALVVTSTAILVSNDPNHAAGDYVFLPALFAIAGVAGFALRERSA